MIFSYISPGQKVQKLVKHLDSLSTTRYMSNFQYFDNVLQFFHTPEGYVKNTPTQVGFFSFDYVYNYTDHLGNIRLSYAQDPQTGAIAILDESHYYPFGLQHSNYNSDLVRIKREEGQNNEKILDDEVQPLFPIANRGYQYKFGGKELQSEFGVEMYDFGARNYDPAIGRWMNVDPLAEKAPHESPYIYVSNSPLVYIDPDGRFKIPVHMRIISNAFKNSGLSSGWKNFFRNDVQLGVSVEADVLGAASDYHFDGRQNYSEVQSTWKSLNSEISSKISDIGSFNKKFGGNDAILFGRMVHTVQDFYSHSNYVELYIDYYKGLNDGAMPTSVPIYDSENGGTNNADFNAILKDNLRTGDFHIIDNEITNPDGTRAQSPTSHNKMNKDKANTPAGRLAEKTATEHTTKIFKQLKVKE